MSRHHRAQKWTTHQPKLRALIAASLPAPCVECGRAVEAEHRWHVGHRVAAAMGGKPTIGNTGPVHVGCNQRAGGRLGARVTNSKRQAAKDIRPW